jgi:hypothetical protein
MIPLQATILSVTIIGPGEVLPVPTMNVDTLGVVFMHITLISSPFAIVNLSVGPPSQISSDVKTSLFGTAWYQRTEDRRSRSDVTLATSSSGSAANASSVGAKMVNKSLVNGSTSPASVTK